MGSPNKLYEFFKPQSTEPLATYSDPCSKIDTTTKPDGDLESMTISVGCEGESIIEDTFFFQNGEIVGEKYDLLGRFKRATQWIEENIASAETLAVAGDLLRTVNPGLGAVVDMTAGALAMAEESTGTLHFMKNAMRLSVELAGFIGASMLSSYVKTGEAPSFGEEVQVNMFRFNLYRTLREKSTPQVQPQE